MILRSTLRVSAAAVLTLLAIALEGGEKPHALDPERDISAYLRDRWDGTNGLPQNSAVALAQTADGYLWMGTENGLSRFDGVRFTTFDPHNTPQMTSASIRALHVGRDGTLWIGTQGGGGLRWKDNSFRPLPSANRVVNTLVNAIHEGPDGSVWFATSGGVSRLRQGRFQHYRTADGLPHNIVSGIAGTEDGTVWFGTDGGLAQFAGGRLTRPAIDGLPQLPVRSVHAYGHTLFVGFRSGGLGIVDARNRRVVRVVRDGLRALDVYSIHRGSDGSVWVGTHGGGIARVRPDGSVESAGEDDDLGSVMVWSLLEDAQGNLWAGTVGDGVWRLRNPRLSTIGRQQGLSQDVVLPVVVGPGGEIWAGTARGGLNRIRGKEIRHWGRRDGLPADLILALALGRDGVVWIGTLAGLGRFDGRRFTRLTVSDGLSSSLIRSIATEGEALWIGTQDAGLDRLAGGRVTNIGEGEGLPHSTVGALRIARDGTLVAMTESGVAFIRDGRVSRTILRGIAVAAMLEDADSTLWFASAGQGLIRVRGEEIRFFRAADGILDDSVHSVAPDHLGNLWCSTNRGIFRVRRQDLESHRPGTRLPVSIYGRADGMLTPECNGGIDPPVARAADGSLLFPTMQGIVRVEPGAIAASAAPPRPVIEQFVADGTLVPHGVPPLLGPDTKRIEIQYTGPELYAPELLRFRYRLEGFDTNWIEARERRNAQYTRLSPGRYRFVVQTIGSNGRVGPDMEFPFRIRPHFYQTPAFYVPAVLLVLAIALAAHRLRMRGLQRRHRELLTHMEYRQRVERELQRSEEHYRSLIENASDLIMVAEEGGVCRYVNKSAERILGHSTEAMEGRPLAEHVHPDDASELARLVDGRTSRSLRLAHASGSWVPLEVVGSRSKDADGRQVIVLNGRDVSERVMMQEQLERANRLGSLGRLAATVSHEFNNVLMGIQPFAAVIRRYVPEDERVQAAAHRIELSVERGKQITSQILRYTRPTPPQPHVVPLRQWVDHLLPELRALLPNVELKVDDLPPIAVVIDLNQMSQVVTNLAINARDAMPSGGTLRFSWREASPGERHPFGIVPQGDRLLHVMVQDTGEGIPPEVIGRIFEPLFSTKRERGTGLGLAVAHQVVHAHGGAIFVESRRGHGTTFHLFLHATDPREESARGVLEEETPVVLPASVRRVLVVEDEPAVAEGITSMLRMHGLEVEHAATGSAARLSLARRRPDAVVLDIALPDADGVELYEDVSVLWPGLPVVFSTAHEERQRVASLLARPHVGFLNKPYDPATLLRALASCAAHASGPGAARPPATCEGAGPGSAAKPA